MNCEESTPRKEKVMKQLSNVKKEESDDNPINKKTSNKVDKLKKKKGPIVKKREKKVYDLPGQKRDPPEERDPLRIFYETLYESVPGSKMGAIWMMESGLLPREKAVEVLEKKQKNAQQQKLSSPMKSVLTIKKKEDPVTVEKKRTSKQKKETPQRKKTPLSKVSSPQSKKRKIQEDSS